MPKFTTSNDPSTDKFWGGVVKHQDEINREKKIRVKYFRNHRALEVKIKTISGWDTANFFVMQAIDTQERYNNDRHNGVEMGYPSLEQREAARGNY